MPRLGTTFFKDSLLLPPQSKVQLIGRAWEARSPGAWPQPPLARPSALIQSPHSILQTERPMVLRNR